MSLKGKILSVYDNGLKAKVSVQPVSDCNGCQACAGLIKMSKAANTHCVVDAFTNNHSVHEGDIVKLELSEFQGSKVAFILYGLPIIFFLVGMLIAPYFCFICNIEVTDIARIICAFSSLFLSLFFIAIYSNKTKKDTFMMSISEVL